MRCFICLALAILLSGCAGPQQTGVNNSKTDRSDAVAAPQLPKGPKLRVGLTDFQDLTGSNLAGAAREVLTERLVNSGRFIVLEREQLARVLQEQSLGMTGAITQETALQAGKLLGLQALITGKLANVSTNTRSGAGGGLGVSTTTVSVRVTVKIIDGTTGQILMADSGEGSVGNTQMSLFGIGGGSNSDALASQAMYQALDQLVARVMVKLTSRPWSSVVVKVSPDKVYIRAGTLSGLAEGAILGVRHVGEDIKDPTTGEILGKELSQRLGTLQVAEHVNEQLSICIPTSGEGFREGDIVELSR